MDFPGQHKEQRISPLDAIKHESTAPRIPANSKLSEAFIELTQELRQQYHIDKGVLIVRRSDDEKLAAISTWSEGLGRDGLTLNLPHKESLFEQVVQQGSVYTENFSDSFSGNFFEKKLLLDQETRSFVLLPLKSEGRVVGLLGYSSQEPTAFTLFEEGELDGAADRLGRIIAGGHSDPATFGT